MRALAVIVLLVGCGFPPAPELEHVELTRPVIIPVPWVVIEPPSD
jgi:hypothetical protein